jgi:hypothetical protein
MALERSREKGGLYMPKAVKSMKKEVKPVPVEIEEEDVSNEDYKDKDALSEEFFEDDEEENVEQGDGDDEAAASASIDTGDDL